MNECLVRPYQGPCTIVLETWDPKRIERNTSKAKVDTVRRSVVLTLAIALGLKSYNCLCSIRAPAPTPTHQRAPTFRGPVA